MATATWTESDVLPVDFNFYFYKDLKQFFGTLQTKGECIRVLVAYEGENWTVPHVCGKRVAYLSMIEKGVDVTWEQVCSL